MFDNLLFKQICGAGAMGAAGLIDAHVVSGKPRAERMLAVSMHAGSIHAAEIAHMLNRSERSIKRWLHRYHKGGCATLCNRPRSGRPRKVSMDTIGDILAGSDAGNGTTARELAARIRNETGIEYHIRSVRRAMKRAGLESGPARIRSRTSGEAGKPQTHTIPDMIQHDMDRMERDSPPVPGAALSHIMPSGVDTTARYRGNQRRTTPHDTAVGHRSGEDEKSDQYKFPMHLRIPGHRAIVTTGMHVGRSVEYPGWNSGARMIYLPAGRRIFIP